MLILLRKTLRKLKENWKNSNVFLPVIQGAVCAGFFFAGFNQPIFNQELILTEIESFENN